MKKKNLAYLMTLAMMGAPLAIAQAEDVDTDVVVEDTATLSVGEEKVVRKIADDFSDFAGDDSETLVEQLRNGDDLSYEVETEQVVVDENGDPVLVEATDGNGDVIMQPVVDENGDPVMVEALDENGEPMLNDNGEPILVQEIEPVMVEQTETVMETIIVENTNGEMGFGEVSLTLGLAESLLGDGASYSDIADALYGDAGILAMRAEGMGWGEIYQSFDMKVGDVMKAVKSHRVADLDAVNRGQAKKIERIEMAGLEKGGKPEKLEKPAKPEKVQRIERPERPEKVSRPDRPERPERVARPERPEKPAKPERPGRG